MTPKKSYTLVLDHPGHRTKKSDLKVCKAPYRTKGDGEKLLLQLEGLYAQAWSLFASQDTRSLESMFFLRCKQEMERQRSQAWKAARSSKGQQESDDIFGRNFWSFQKMGAVFTAIVKEQLKVLYHYLPEKEEKGHSNDNLAVLPGPHSFHRLYLGQFLSPDDALVFLERDADRPNPHKIIKPKPITPQSVNRGKKRETKLPKAVKPSIFTTKT